MQELEGVESDGENVMELACQLMKRVQKETEKNK
jgi:hypothetical protein